MQPLARCLQAVRQLHGERFPARSARSQLSRLPMDERFCTVNAAAPGPVTAAIFCASCFSALLQSEADANVDNSTMRQYNAEPGKPGTDEPVRKAHSPISRCLECPNYKSADAWRRSLPLYCLDTAVGLAEQSFSFRPSTYSPMASPSAVVLLPAHSDWPDSPCSCCAARHWRKRTCRRPGPS